MTGFKEALMLVLFLASPNILAVDPSCECVEFRSTFGQQYGHFTSPDFPKPYDPGIGCVLYTFTSPSVKRDEIVELTIHYLNLRPSSTCGEGDHLSLYLHLEKGEVNEKTPSNAKLCALSVRHPSSRGPPTPVRFYSALSTLVMAFQTGRSTPQVEPSSTSSVISTSVEDVNGRYNQTSSAFGFNGTYRFIRRNQFRSDGQRIAGTVCDYQFISQQGSSGTPGSALSPGLRKGKFFSPLYPSVYPTRSKCLYHFYGRYQERVKINFEKLILGDEDMSCLTSEDGVRVYDGSDVQSPVIAHLCGAVQHVELWSSSQSFLVEFYSSLDPSAQTYEGFEARFSFLPALSAINGDDDEEEEEEEDVPVEEVEEEEEEIEDVQHKSLSPNLVLSTAIRTPSPITIGTVPTSSIPLNILTKKQNQWTPKITTVAPLITFSRTIATTARPTPTSIRRIQTIPTRTTMSTTTIRTTVPSTTVRPTTPYLTPNLPSLPVPSDARHQSSPFFPFDFNTSSPCDRVFRSDSEKNGTFTSPNYSSSYSPSMNCNYEFRGHGRERVQIVFTDFVLHHPHDDPNEKPSHPWLRQSCDGADRVTAFISIGGNKEKIDDFCGSGTPRELMSNSATMSLHFHSTAVSKGARGFKARYAFVSNFGITTGEQISSMPCGFRFNSSTASNGTFWSPNFPGFYPRDTECHYFFHALVGERVKIVFSYFDIEGMIPCGQTSASDYLEVSNFMTVDRKLPRYCGQLKDLKMESDGSFFRVTFKSNDRFDGTGFFAHYQFTPVADAVTITRRRSSATNNHPGSAGCLLLVYLLAYLSS